MKAIFTKRRSDGAYDDVGMRSRFMRSVNSVKHAARIARAFGDGCRVRVELYADDRVYEPKPNRVFFVD